MQRQPDADVTDAARPRLSVLVVSYNVAPLLRECLASLAEADEVVVVDNASSDGSTEMVRREFPGVTLVASRENRGFSAAVNVAAGAATGDLLLLLNPDAAVAPGVLGAMRAALGRRPDAAAIGFRQVDSRGAFQLSFGPPPSLVLELIRMIVQRRLDAGDRRLARLVDRLVSRPVKVPWVSGSAFLVRRAAFEAVGGFDEAFFLYFEDIDFCLRLRKEVGSVYYVPEPSVLHHRGRSAAGDPAEAGRAYRRSQLLYWRRYRGDGVARLIQWYQRLRAVAKRRVA
jgi:N-acetylglucosaminyl-diphospho-decaprenol L-rhamnosyltransferase